MVRYFRPLSLSALATVVAVLAGCANVPPVSGPEEVRDGGVFASPAGDGAPGGTSYTPPEGPAAPTAPETGPATPPTAPGTNAPTEGLATGIAVRGLVAAQALEVPLDPQRGVVALPLVARKPTVLRALVDVLPGVPPQSVRAVLEVDDQLFEDTQVISASSDEATMSRAFHFELPAEVVTPTTRIALRLLALNDGPEREVGHPASWPSTGVPAPLGAVESGPLKVVFFPVLDANGAGNNEVHLTPERLEDLRQALLARYPVSDDRLETEVRPTYTLRSTVRGTCNGWDPVTGESRQVPCVAMYALLDQLVALHLEERADRHTVYVGLVSFDGDERGTEGDILGVGTGPAWEDLRSAPGLALAAAVTYMDDVPVGGPEFDPELIPLLVDVTVSDLDCPEDIATAYFESLLSPDTSHNTLAHEVGHTLSLRHVNSLDMDFGTDDHETDFPRADGRIGRTGYDIRKDMRLVSQCTIDFMSYTLTGWTSDFTWKRLFDVLTDPSVDGFDRFTLPPRPHLVALVRLEDGAPVKGRDLRFGWRAPHGVPGRPVPVVARDAAGGALARSTATFAVFSDGGAGQLFVPEVVGAARYEIELAQTQLSVPAALVR
jgi:hypothetical protein